MHADWSDPEISRQLFENAIAATAMSFLGLAALVAIVAGIFIVGECLRLLTEPAPAPRVPAMRAGHGLQIVYRSTPPSTLAASDKIHA